MKHRLERRFTAQEVRMVGEGEARKIVGYAAVFNSQSRTLREGGKLFRETIRPGAFAEALKTADVRALFNHDATWILGRSTAGTLRLSEDETGLRYEIDPPSGAMAQHVREAIERGDISGSSFQFRVLKDEWRQEGGATIREIIQVGALIDVGPVTFPAYDDTAAGVRAEDEPPADDAPADPPATPDMMKACTSMVDACKAATTQGRALVDAATAMAGEPTPEMQAACKEAIRHIRTATDTLWQAFDRAAWMLGPDYARAMSEAAGEIRAMLDKTERKAAPEIRKWESRIKTLSRR